MPEYIDREQLDKAYLMLGYGEEELPRRMLQMMPDEEVAKVVRCKDCKYWDKRDFKDSGICLEKKNPIFFLTANDFYCACGERREGE